LNIRAQSLSLHIFIIIANILLPAPIAAAQEIKSIPASLPGIDVISPVQHATVEPGQALSVNNVFTFRNEGLLNPVGPGTAYLIVRHRDLLDFVLVEVTEQDQDSPPAINQTSKVMIKRSQPRLVPDTFLYEVEVTIRNDSSLPLSLPLHLVITGLDKNIVVSGQSVTRQVAPPGSPAIFIRTDGLDYLSPGAYTRAIIKFRNSEQKEIDYLLNLYSGVEI